MIKSGYKIMKNPFMFFKKCILLKQFGFISCYIVKYTQNYFIIIIIIMMANVIYIVLVTFSAIKVSEGFSSFFLLTLGRTHLES